MLFPKHLTEIVYGSECCFCTIFKYSLLIAAFKRQRMFIVKLIYNKFYIFFTLTFNVTIKYINEIPWRCGKR